MKSRLLYLFLLLLLITGSCKKEGIKINEGVYRYDADTLYTRIYRLIDLREYELAFTELQFYLRFLSDEERREFDLQNLFAKYVIEAQDSLEDMVENYIKIFPFLGPSDAEAAYQILIYRSSLMGDLEKVALVVASKADRGRAEAGIYYFLSYTFFNLRMYREANNYLDCLITIAPDHPATSYLVFKIRGKKPEYRAESIIAMQNLFNSDKSEGILVPIAQNFHIPAMMNKDWERIGMYLLSSDNYRVRLVAYSEIPIFFARKRDEESLYLILKRQILQKDYRLFSLALRSLLYVYDRPYVVVERLKEEFADHPFVKSLYARYLLSLGGEYVSQSIDPFIEALEKENNIEILYDAFDAFRSSSSLFKLKSFIEELLYMYPYSIELYNLYKKMNPYGISDELFERYFERIPESVNRYILLSSISDDRKKKEYYLLKGLENYRGDCAILVELLRLYSDCEAERFDLAFKKHLKNYLNIDELYRCTGYMNDVDKKRYGDLISKGVREGCVN